MDEQAADQKGWKEREQTTIRLPAELKEALQREADQQGITLHDLIVFILWKGLQHTVPE